MEYSRLKKVSLQAWSPSLRVFDGNLDGQPGNIRETAALVEGIRSASRDDRRGHPASLASQASGEDSVGTGNYTAGSIATLCQGAFGFAQPRGMVFAFCRRHGSANALKTIRPTKAKL
jgi:hypothetical protein